MMKGSFAALEHYAFVIAMLSFAVMAYMDYSRDGDRINLAFAVVLTALAILATYFYSFHKWKQGKDE